MSAAPMSSYDADFDAPGVPRKGVSAEQQVIIVGDADLTDIEKSKALDTLSDVATGDYAWPNAEERLAEEFANLYGMAKGSDGLWRDAMVPVDPERPENGYEFDPASVA